MFFNKSNVERPEAPQDYILVQRSSIREDAERKNGQKEQFQIPQTPSNVGPPKGLNDSKIDAGLAVAGSGTVSSVLQTKKGSRRTAPSLPPALEATPMSTFRMRFRASATGTFSITGNNLAGAMGAVVYTANSLARAHFGTARLHSITVWNPARDAVTVVSDLRWSTGVLSTLFKDTDQIRSTPDGVSNTAPSVFVPPSGTLCGAWMQLGAISSGVLFILELTAGAIVDVHVSGTLANNVSGATISVSAGAVGTQGYTALNGANGSLEHQGMATILT